MDITDEHTCDNCSFSDLVILTFTDQNDVEAPHLICRRYPPQNTEAPEYEGGGTRSTWPLIHDTDWCGEFVEKTTKGE